VPPPPVFPHISALCLFVVSPSSAASYDFSSGTFALHNVISLSFQIQKSYAAFFYITLSIILGVDHESE
jgi:hypothetical protein